MSGFEEHLVSEVFRSNWIAPLGPQVEAFQHAFAEYVNTPHALALSSGTAALHLALQEAGVGPGDEVFVSTLTFAASVNPIRYLGAAPVFIDSEVRSWNMDPALLAEALREKAKVGRLPKAVVVVHLYGQCADLDPIVAACAEYEVPLIEDAAEALGANYKGASPGTFGLAGIFSFNGNKVITTGGGGMLISPDEDLIRHALKLSTQALDPAAHYEHSEVGYNYRLSNVLAAIGAGQLRVLPERVEARRRNFAYYEANLGDLPGLRFEPEAEWGTHARWLTTCTIDPFEFGADRKAVRLALAADDIEARPVWKPMHQQPVFAGFECVGSGVADSIFATGLCLPSGSNMTVMDLERVCDAVRNASAHVAEKTRHARAG